MPAPAAIPRMAKAVAFVFAIPAFGYVLAKIHLWWTLCRPLLGNYKVNYAKSAFILVFHKEIMEVFLFLFALGWLAIMLYVIFFIPTDKSGNDDN